MSMPIAGSEVDECCLQQHTNCTLSYVLWVLLVVGWWISLPGLFSYTQSAPVLAIIEHLCLMNLPVSYVECDATHTRSPKCSLIPRPPHVFHHGETWVRGYPKCTVLPFERALHEHTGVSHIHQVSACALAMSRVAKSWRWPKSVQTLEGSGFREIWNSSDFSIKLLGTSI